LRQVVSSGKIPVLDIGTVEKISAGAIKIARGISAIEAGAVVFEGGSKEKFETIIFATGYRPNYQSFLGPDLMHNRHGKTMADAKDHSATIHFVGFHNPVTGLLREISREAVKIVSGIVRSRSLCDRKLLGP